MAWLSGFFPPGDSIESIVHSRDHRSVTGAPHSGRLLGILWDEIPWVRAGTESLHGGFNHVFFHQNDDNMISFMDFFRDIDD